MRAYTRFLAPAALTLLTAAATLGGLHLPIPGQDVEIASASPLRAAEQTAERAPTRPVTATDLGFKTDKTRRPLTASDLGLSRHAAEVIEEGVKPLQPLQIGEASWYGKPFHGRTTANGERFDMYRMTAAHRTLPLGTVVEVRNVANGKSAVVRINDRGPYAGDRVIDLSRAAAQRLGFIEKGVAEVEILAVDEDLATAG